mmetsp:Transcript_889/g.2032  ORF Transcript_889/g.2032 Transcript_889/m.2032 type:complete len:206 (+) Transcript_889:886-1503(+)
MHPHRHFLISTIEFLLGCALLQAEVLPMALVRDRLQRGPLLRVELRARDQALAQLVHEAVELAVLEGAHPMPRVIIRRTDEGVDRVGTEDLVGAVLVLDDGPGLAGAVIDLANDRRQPVLAIRDGLALQDWRVGRRCHRDHRRRGHRHRTWRLDRRSRGLSKSDALRAAPRRRRRPAVRRHLPPALLRRAATRAAGRAADRGRGR